MTNYLLTVSATGASALSRANPNQTASLERERRFCQRAGRCRHQARSRAAGAGLFQLPLRPRRGRKPAHLEADGPPPSSPATTTWRRRRFRLPTAKGLDVPRDLSVVRLRRHVDCHQHLARADHHPPADHRHGRGSRLDLIVQTIRSHKRNGGENQVGRSSGDLFADQAPFGGIRAAVPTINFSP